MLWAAGPPPSPKNTASPKWSTGWRFSGPAPSVLVTRPELAHQAGRRPARDQERPSIAERWSKEPDSSSSARASVRGPSQGATRLKSSGQRLSKNDQPTSSSASSDSCATCSRLARQRTSTPSEGPRLKTSEATESASLQKAAGAPGSPSAASTRCMKRSTNSGTVSSTAATSAAITHLRVWNYTNGSQEMGKGRGLHNMVDVWGLCQVTQPRTERAC